MHRPYENHPNRPFSLLNALSLMRIGRDSSRPPQLPARLGRRRSVALVDVPATDEDAIHRVPTPFARNRDAHPSSTAGHTQRMR